MAKRKNYTNEEIGAAVNIVGWDIAGLRKDIQNLSLRQKHDMRPVAEKLMTWANYVLWGLWWPRSSKAARDKQ